MTEPHDYSAELPPEPPAWPKVVGGISIGLATLGLLCGACGAVWLAFMPQFMQMLEEQFKEPAPAVMRPSPQQVVQAVAGFAWSGLLLAAGILGVLRRPATRFTHLVWAVGAIALGAWGTAMMLQQQAAIAQWARENPASEWAKNQSPLGALIGLVLGLLFGFAWPLFCLIWFGLVKRRPGDLTGAAGPVA